MIWNRPSNKTRLPGLGGTASRPHRLAASRCLVNSYYGQFFDAIGKNSKGANVWQTRLFKGDDEISTVGIKRLADVSLRWIGLRGRMRMVDAQVLVIHCAEILEE